ncbi:unnamed protein product [Phytomonas sp. EM1]|nr:unnamed protein product [Phytomonas sp. EM1]|eukprot:CCW61895.1 unnamed protein product [Phytomonas sp. isolate EM1]
MQKINHRCSHYPALQLTGRCVLLMKSMDTNKDQHRSSFMELTSSSSLNEGNDVPISTRQAFAIPQSLSGNSYYHRRFLGSASSRQQVDPPGSLGLRSETHLNAGDLLLHAISSSVSRHLRHLPMADVTGIRTSYFDASERSKNALATLDEVVETMHWHDGSEVPALKRGEVPVGRLVVLCTYPTRREFHKQGLPAVEGRCSTEKRVPCVSVPLFRALQASVMVENAGVFFLNRRGSLFYHSDFEALQMAKAVAARCHSVCRRTMLRPRVRDGNVVGVQLVM